MKKIFLGLLLLCGISMQSQTGTIKGVVLDKQSENPLEGATVELLNMDIATGVITDFNGRFFISWLFSGLISGLLPFCV